MAPLQSSVVGRSIKVTAAVTASLAICMCLALAPSAGAVTAVSAGDLRAEIGGDPWALRFVQDRGPTLSQSRATGTGSTGTLGFRTAAGWFRSTKVLSRRRDGRAYEVELATTDPDGRRLTARLKPDGEGAIALRASIDGSRAGVTAVGIGFDRAGPERYLGFGERSNAVDQRGQTVENYVYDGPWQPEERPFIRAFIPAWGFGERDDSTYFPMPWVVSTSGYGVLVDNLERSYFRMGSDRADAWSLEAEARELSMRVFAGPEPADVVRRLTERVGRQPERLAPWMSGAWFHTGQENQPPEDEERRYVELQRDGDAPVSAVETHLRYLPCGAAVGKRARERERTSYLHRQGLATISYLNPEICTDYEPVYGEAVRRDVLTEDAHGDPYVYNAYVGDRTPPLTPISQVDFSARGSFDFFSELMSQPVDDGHDGWMEDFGEYTPPDSRSANGMTGARMHNYYHVLYHRAGWRFAKRQSRPISRHVRSGWTGVHPYAQIVWGGDPATDWGFDGLSSAVKQALSMGMSGISIWGSDIGGFFSLGDNRLTPELLKRWVQFGAVSGVMRTKKAGVAVPPYERPQVWEPDQLPNWRRYSKLRTQLYPYITAADAEYQRSGMPIMRHLSLSYPDDSRATAREDEFLFGDKLLAAPVLRPGARQRDVYLPRGRWVDLWRSVDYRDRTGGLRLEGVRDLRGARSATLPAPIDELPLLVRSGTVLALLPDDVDTLADYGKRSLVKLDDRRDRMGLLAFPRGSSSDSFNEGERLRSSEGDGNWRLKLRGERERRYRLQASLATLKQRLNPCRVELDGRKLAKRRWSYDERSKVLKARFDARNAKLTVSGCAFRRSEGPLG